MLFEVWVCPQLKNIPSCTLCVDFQLHPLVVTGVISLSRLANVLIMYSLFVLSLSYVQ